MTISLEDTLLNVWRQSLLENKRTVTLEVESFPVRSTAKRKLKQIDFQFDGKDLRGLEQNPNTWIRREFHSFPSKVAENPAFVSRMFASVARFSQT